MAKLESSSSFILHFTQNQISLLVETWDMALNPGRITQSSPPKVPTLNSSMTFDDQGISTPVNAELRIPYENVFDIAPPPGVRDIVITNATLQARVKHIFSGLK